MEKFDRNVESLKSAKYNETQLRQEYINPFFKALGWDVYNEKGSLGLYREVVHEDSVKVKKATKNPDYGFYVGRSQKFFVEAKKPSVNLENDIRAAFQLRSYGWSAGLPISLLTDFEEFAIYDCRIEPSNTDSPRVGLLRHFTYDKYIDHWDEIAALFSREAVLGGSLERYIESKKKAKGTIAVDEAFLREIDHWREILARNIFERNPGLSVRELNSSVQNTIDRIVFLRICEDRGIERFGQLKGIVKGEKAVYTMLVELFKGADEKYNSGLFHFGSDPGRIGEPDRLALSLKIDDEILSEMIENLYPPRSPYRFSVIPAEILGHVYEQFLGKVISLGEDGGVEVEYKPEVRKAGGVYYTPTYIVDYIVENTVGKLLEGQTPTAVSDLRILDPACGSGSFLIGAYQRLLDWHLEWYTSHLVPHLAAGKAEGSKEVQALLPAVLSAAGNVAGAAKKRGRGRPRKNSSAAATASGSQRVGSFPIFQAEGGDWKLATAERKRILLNNIYGVDIDLAAVEVTKLSLQLKVLEGENQGTLSRQLTLFKERALPDLGENIKCGNSLIGPDFYDRQTSLFDEEEMYRVNAFDWDAEFPDIMGQGGFDAVIGNPPYVRTIERFEQMYFSKHYQNQNYQKDLYLLFLERYYYLLNYKGLLGVIISNTWLLSVRFKRIRQYLTKYYLWLRILHLPEKVFRAVVDTHVLIFQKNDTTDNEDNTLEIDIRRGDNISSWHKIPWKEIPKNGDPINIVAPVKAQMLFRSINKMSSPLMQLCDVYNGVKPFEKGKGNPPQTEGTMKEKPYVKTGSAPESSWSPLLRGSLIRRYQNVWNNDYWILYGPWLAAPRNPKIFDAPLKITVRQTGDSIISTLIEPPFVARDNLHIILPMDGNYNLKYILGILNSKLTDFAYSTMNPEKGEALAQVKKRHVEKLPIRTIDFSDPEDVARHDKMVALVERMLDLHRRLSESKTGHEKTLLSRQIEATDGQIDSLVYELYGLSEEEVAIVEEAAR
ncbi:N-6 DNA methylase [Methanotrichaceae archaeon M04Ac]|uniref:site-specific DNA-methyltransferase (adenine-specific) n=1 Tax=Candidatus Methanocrinis alkalitolerans TaxID=3033395 RepID=A0ABT5XC57_9EURY|nr:N-6 DNA methylase [Candidatus Methanocrinis alkalitolerans]MDF0592298.1 N-6 DNA methylase [Candidatus Methanocrinis alkalitolerans]